VEDDSIIREQQYSNVREFLNRGIGVLDVAGGAGYLSLEFALAGIQCTVVDARKSVRCLPMRDRNQLKKKLKKQQERMLQENISDDNSSDVSVVVPFGARRAWFGSKPPVDEQKFRQKEEDGLPVFSLDTCNRGALPSALVGLHADEATAEIVYQAVKYRIPFIVVPCCVFARVFPHRKMRNGRKVSSYEDFLTYLQEQDQSIQQNETGFPWQECGIIFHV
jgi:hypothetical protein